MLSLQKASKNFKTFTVHIDVILGDREIIAELQLKEKKTYKSSKLLYCVACGKVIGKIHIEPDQDRKWYNGWEAIGTHCKDCNGSETFIPLLFDWNYMEGYELQLDGYWLFFEIESAIKYLQGKRRKEK